MKRGGLNNPRGGVGFEKNFGVFLTFVSFRQGKGNKDYCFVYLGKQIFSMKKRLIQIGIVCLLLFVLELFLSLAGHQAGMFIPDIYPLDTLISKQKYQADSLGITSFMVKSKYLSEGYFINKQGFRSPIDFDKKSIDSVRVASQKDIVMLIGDSYTEGCCAQPIDSSFADLIYKDEAFTTLNFGVGSTGLSQYQLIANHYIEKLRPNLVIIAFYLGNDFLYYERPVTPNVPVCYQIKDFVWLNSVGPPYYMLNNDNEYFKTKEEAYSFYLSNYTLWGKEVNWMERILRQSILLSKLYLGAKEKLAQIKWGFNEISKDNDVALTNQILKNINETCKRNQTELLVLGIPSPQDAKHQVDLNEKYGEYFHGIESRFPNISLFSVEDYDGKELSNHFNNLGHQKWYRFLKTEIENALKKN